MLAQVFSGVGYTLQPWIGSNGSLIGSVGQFAVDLLLFRSLNFSQRPALPLSLLLGIPACAAVWLLLEQNTDYFWQILLSSGSAIAVSVWQISELVRPLRRDNSKYLLFITGTVLLQILMHVIRIDIAHDYGNPMDHPFAHHSVFDDHLPDFIVRLVLLIGYALIFVVISNYFLDRLYRRAALRAEENESEMHKSLNALAMARENETGKHVLRTQRYVQVLATRMQTMGVYPEQISDSFIDRLCKATPLHDIGKVAIPDHILLKPGPLTTQEHEVMKTHAALGERILSAARSQRLGTNEVLDLGIRVTGSHHEHWDGTGYPQGLRGTDIPLEARIMALADTYDALTCQRVYKAAWPQHQVLQKLSASKALSTILSLSSLS